MSISGHDHDEKRRQQMLEQTPGVQIFLQPIAPPAALGLAGFAGSTWITSSYIANWWGSPDSPTIFFPFVGIFGGLAQFIAGLQGFKARDTLVTVINTMWGSFWIAIGILYAFVVSLHTYLTLLLVSRSLTQDLLPPIRPRAPSRLTRCTRTSRSWRLGSWCCACSRGRARWRRRRATWC